MSSVNDLVLHPTAILNLRPTQMTVGLIEVRRKRDLWKTKTDADLERFLSSHMAPTILGPGNEHYLIDNHHLARALFEEGVKSIFVAVVADLTRLPLDHFWTMMDFKGWTHPYDEVGRRRAYSDLPSSVKKMADDPYRSLAGELRNYGGFAKDSTPFAEFLWADFLRPRIKAKAIAADFEGTLAEALTLAKSPEAAYLPGWSGPHGYVRAQTSASKPMPKKAKVG